MIVASILCFIAALVSFLMTRQFTKNAVQVQGRVVEVTHRRLSNEDSYFPVVSFTDENGVEHTVNMDVGSNPPAHHKGDLVTILYQPTKPDDARMADFMELWIVPLVTGGLGVISLPAGLIILNWPRNGKRDRKRKTGRNGKRDSSDLGPDQK